MLQRSVLPMLAAIALAYGFALTSANAASVTANGSAEVIVPITITQQDPLDFGIFSVGGTGGTVIMQPAGERSATGDVELVAGGAVSNGVFGLTGEPNQAYSVTLPSSTTVTDGSETMTVDTFSYVTGGGDFIGGSGFSAFDVSAVLHVDPNQTINSYSGTYPVSVVYD